MMGLSGLTPLVLACFTTFAGVPKAVLVVHRHAGAIPGHVHSGPISAPQPHHHPPGQVSISHHDFDRHHHVPPSHDHGTPAHDGGTW